MYPPERPRRPGRKGTIADWNRYHEAKFQYDVWKQGQRTQQGQRPQRERYNPSQASKEVKAVYNPNTGITENYYGGYWPEGDGPWHGHTTINSYGDVAHPKGGRPAGEKK